MCHKVNDAKPLKTSLYIILRFLLTNHHITCIVYCRLARLTVASKIILSAAYYRISLEGYPNYMW